MRYTNNYKDFNSVINLLFFQMSSEEFNTHIVLLDLQSPFNHASLLVNIIIRKEFIQYKKWTIIKNSEEVSYAKSTYCHMQVYPSGNYILAVISPPNYTSPPSMAATFLATYLMVVLQLSVYSIFHGRDTSIRLGLLWWGYSCQYLNTETSAQGK